MKNKKEKILGFDVCTLSEKSLINNIFNDYKNNEKIFIVNINPEIIINNYKNSIIKEIYNSQKYQIPDGIGIVLASKLRHGNIKNRITGIDFMIKICEKSIEYNSKIFLYGSKRGIAEKAKKELLNKFNNINIVGVSDGYTDEKKVIDYINETHAEILFVGLGNPKQEKFIIDNINNLKSVKIFMPVGGSFDIISNTLKRAPQLFIKLNLEWLYRMLQEPKRFFRQIKLIKFLFVCIFYRKK